MLAQIPGPTQAQFGEWIWGLIGFAGLVLLVLQIVKHFRRHPPIEVEFASRGEVEALKRLVTSEQERMSRDISDRVTRHEFASFSGVVTTELKTLSATIAANQLRVVEQLQDMATTLAGDSERRSSKIHERIDALSVLVAALNERTRREGME